MPNAQSNSPNSSPLLQYSVQQLLVLILTELRIHSQLLVDEQGGEADLDQMRLATMNSNDIVAGDGA